MTAEIVALDGNRPHVAGPVVCARCQHAWVALRPVGVIFLECPKCEASFGSDFMTMLEAADQFLGDTECCGQVDSAGVCCAPACIRGTALKLIDTIRLAYSLEHEEPTDDRA